MPEVQDRIEKLGNSILSDAQKKAGRNNQQGTAAG